MATQRLNAFAVGLHAAFLCDRAGVLIARNPTTGEQRFMGPLKLAAGCHVSEGPRQKNGRLVRMCPNPAEPEPTRVAGLQAPGSRSSDARSFGSSWSLRSEA